MNYYLTQAPALDETLAYFVDFNMRYIDLDKKLQLTGLNMLLCGFEGKTLESFKTETLPRLATLCADPPPWDNDAAALEARAECWFTEMEADIEAYAAFAGEQYAALLEAEAAR
jgi:hypothetical protein